MFTVYFQRSNINNNRLSYMKSRMTQNVSSQTPPSKHSISSYQSFKIHTSTSTRSTNSTYKSSVRKLLSDKTFRDRRQEIIINLTYNDITVPITGKVTSEIEKFLCHKGVIDKARTCKCFDSINCEWVDKWLIMFPNHCPPMQG